MRVTVNARELVRGLDELAARAIPGAVRRAMTRTMRSVSVAMARAVAEDMNLPVGVVKKELRVQVTESAASPADFVGQVSVSGKPIPLIDFKGTSGPRPSRGRRGRGVMANTGGGRKRYEGAFIAPVNGKDRVFRRVGTSLRKSQGAWSKNLPIVQLHGPSLPHVFGKKVDVGIARGEEQLLKELQHEVRFALEKAASS